MGDRFQRILIALVVMVALWSMVAGVARLPAGVLQELVGFLPACVTLPRRLPPYELRLLERLVGARSDESGWP